MIISIIICYLSLLVLSDFHHSFNVNVCRVGFVGGAITILIIISYKTEFKQPRIMIRSGPLVYAYYCISKLNHYRLVKWLALICIFVFSFQFLQLPCSTHSSSHAKYIKQSTKPTRKSLLLG